ncbi:T9SS type A sorting domain-containing protein [Hymenobacter sp. YC55]|uniref:T9SS type A sorting domain-containing protein n=1 Tax=Hymenobacter sp. YC55 TaxID=3034019 RepID=UPI0023FA4528|nr:T9SS type A sorting domain-containing protein [Hymenobacter sp. YC55]MDF7812661.1 T9SS type A sorting domain-containing protein [Hymenobacter sp. YC55]
MRLPSTLVCLIAALLSFTSAEAQTKVPPKPVAKPPVKAAVTAAKTPVPVAAKKPAAPAPATKPVAAATPKPAAAPAKPAVAEVEPPALVTDKMAEPVANTTMLKVLANANPVTRRLTVRTNSPNPTRVEINGPDGRPLITRDLISSNDVAVLDVSNLPPGAYIVQCTSGERRGMKRIVVGQ